MEQCLNKLPKDNLNLQILNMDIKYNVSVNNNKNEKEREEKITIIGKKERLNLQISRLKLSQNVIGLTRQ